VFTYESEELRTKDEDLSELKSKKTPALQS